MPHVTANGASFHYQQAGAGDDVVLLHAVTANLAVWLFSGLPDALATDWRVTAYDLRGHGLSETTPTGYTSAEMATDFAALHESLGLGPAYLVGHSFGGVVALHAAILYPDKVRGVILSDPYFPGLAAIEPNLPSANVWLDLRAAFGHAGVALPGEVDFKTLFRAVAGLTPPQMAAIREKMGAASSRWLAGLPRLAETTCGDDLFAVAGLTAERIAEVRQPVVALYDEHSPFLATCKYLEGHLPDCAVDIVPGAKHLAPVQNPAAFTGLVTRHLTRLRSRRVHPAGASPAAQKVPLSPEGRGEGRKIEAP
jgi:pimeloyl-ACP methyl ester carboxylesterase